MSGVVSGPGAGLTCSSLQSRAQGHFWFLVSGMGSLESPMVSTSNFHSTNLFLFPRHHISTNRVAPFSAYKHAHNPQSCICSEGRASWKTCCGISESHRHSRFNFK